MSIFKTLSIIAPLALSTAAMAAPAHFTDSQYIAAARCQALMASSELGRQDTKGIDALLKSEGRAREQLVLDRADEARQDAVRAARHAGTYAKASLVAERDSVCQTLTSDGVMSASATAGGATRTN
jgi:hypothetical protein